MVKLLKETVVLKKTLVFITVFGLRPIESAHRNMWNIAGVESDYNSFLNDSNFDMAYTLNTSGCTIPKLMSDDYSIRDFIHYPRDIEWCPGQHRPLLQSNQTHIWVNTKYFKYYDINNKTEFNCCYRSFHRSAAILGKVIYLDCITFKKSIKVSNEFVKVECYYYDNLIREEYFVFVPKMPFIEIDKHPLEIDKDKATFNVIILGLSSVSRISAHRTMPKTLYLLEQLGAVELLGYHVVGEGSSDNVLPVLANMMSYELNITCWPHTQDMFDVCPFIWERFKNGGFITAFIQDNSKSRLFDRDMFSFYDRLPDYYIHDFIKESEINEIRQHLNKGNHKKKTRLFNKRHNRPAVCIKDKFYFRLILDYLETLANISRTSKLFGLFWESSLSRNLNAPMIMDEEYEKLIQNLYQSGYLNETVLILISEEGMPHGQIQTTKQGRLEQKLPLASILVPPVFREQYNVAYQNLKTNSERLTTPFDLHETLVDLIDLNEVEDYEIQLRKRSNLTYERGVSLFMPIHSNRTCESAGIYNFWCTCHRRKKINVKRKFVLNAANYIITHLNWLLKLYPHCSKLELESIMEFEELWPSYGKEIEWREFRTEIRVTPGAGEFEAFLRRDKLGWSLMAHVRRLDDYNKPGDCSTDDFIKWYCEC